MVGFIFPGQGAQYIGMGKDLYEAFAESKAVFDKANSVLGFDLKKLCFEGPENMLKMTYICQPAILTVSIACLEALRAKLDIVAGYTAGLSLGEYSALVAAGVLQFQDALKVVRRRAALMDEAAKENPGKMAAIIGLDRDEVESLCRVSGRVSIANLNCPEQVVISGEKEAVDKAKDLALQKGAKKAIDLEVSGAFHSSLMRGVAKKFKEVLERVNFKEAKMPLVGNVDADATINPLDIRQNLEKQIYSPVLWEDSMRFILAQGINKFYEIGPGKVLKGLMRRIDENAEVINIEKKEDIIKFVSV